MIIENSKYFKKPASDSESLIGNFTFLGLLLLHIPQTVLLLFLSYTVYCTVSHVKKFPLPLSFQQGNNFHFHFVRLTASFIITSCAPPSRSVTGDTSVSFAFSLISHKFNAPQLQNVDLILLSVSVTLSRKLPA